MRARAVVGEAAREGARRVRNLRSCVRDKEDRVMEKYGRAG